MATLLIAMQLEAEELATHKALAFRFLAAAHQDSCIPKNPSSAS
jgi:hypothetical protein